VEYGKENVVAGGHGALARVAHGQSVEQANQGENAMDQAFLAAYERERTVLGLEAMERVDENVHSA
jgi:hypothetical protein